MFGTWYRAGWKVTNPRGKIKSIIKVINRKIDIFLNLFLAHVQVREKGRVSPVFYRLIKQVPIHCEIDGILISINFLSVWTVHCKTLEPNLSVKYVLGVLAKLCNSICS